MVNARVARGRKTQELLACRGEDGKPLGWFNRNGWPDAWATAASIPGRDLRDMLGLAPEVKASADLDPTGLLRQAVANAGTDLPFGVYRPRGFGPERIGQWVVFIRLEDFTTLLHEAGYGTAEEGAA